MRNILRHSAVVLGAGLYCTAINIAHTQEQIQWLVHNPISATILPLYAGQRSPFPYQANSRANLSDLEQAKINFNAQLQAQMGRLNALIKSQKALVPDLAKLNFKALLSGPKGQRALINGSWYAQGQILQLPTQASGDYVSALQQLRQLDPNAVDPLASNYQKMNVKIQNITSSSLVLSSPYQAFKLTLRSHSY